LQISINGNIVENHLQPQRAKSIIRTGRKPPINTLKSKSYARPRKTTKANRRERQPKGRQGFSREIIRSRTERNIAGFSPSQADSVAPVAPVNEKF
jgi:hypothetical protein